MRAASLWTIAACLAALAAVARADTTEKEKMKLVTQMSKCCAAFDKVISIFRYGLFTCGGSYLYDKLVSFFSSMWGDPDVTIPDLKDGCVMKCLFEDNGFMVANSTLEDKMKKMLMEKFEKSNEATKVIIQTGLKECLALAKAKAPSVEATIIEEGIQRRCKQEAQLLMACFFDYVLYECPQSEWNNKRKDCTGQREQLRSKLSDMENEVMAKQNAVEAKTELNAVGGSSQCTLKVKQ